MTSLADNSLQILTGWTGLDLTRYGPTVLDFVERRSQELGFSSPTDYLRHAIHLAQDEAGLLLDQIRVHCTWMYRDPEQLDLLAEILREKPADGPVIDIWVAGCASGEDAYSVAMLAHQSRRNVRILATDISPTAIAQAEQGFYNSNQVRHLPASLLPCLLPQGEGFRVLPELRAKIQFSQHNLLTPAPMPPSPDGWAIILCRNVIMYFTPEHVQATLTRLTLALTPGGYLFLGAGEFQIKPPALERVQLGGRFVFMRPRSPTSSGEALRSPPAGYTLPPLPLFNSPSGAAPLSPPGPLPAPRPISAPGLSLPSWVRQSSPTLSPLNQPPGPSRSSTSQPATRTPTRTPSQPPAQSPPSSGQNIPSTLTEDGRLAAALLRRGEPEAALQKLSRYRDRPGLSAEILLLIGMAEHMRGHHADALLPLRQALFFSPQLWPAALYLALSFQQLGRNEDAQQSFERVLRLRNTPRRDSGPILSVLDLDALRADLFALADRQVRSISNRLPTGGTIKRSDRS